MAIVVGVVCTGLLFTMNAPKADKLVDWANWDAISKSALLYGYAEAVCTGGRLWRCENLMGSDTGDARVKASRGRL